MPRILDYQKARDLHTSSCPPHNAGWIFVRGCVSSPSPKEVASHSKHEVILPIGPRRHEGVLCSTCDILIPVWDFFFLIPSIPDVILIPLLYWPSLQGQKFEIILVKCAPSRLANSKIRAFCTRKDFLAQCVSSFSCSWIFQFVA